ncbi:Target SNARE coiled-coil domain protein [Niveomyces insectorum RCEF 264]|uniref:Target SNARE coiled-coil domain protein n=1 Tax=Niveomyces insectorum RCEF 264 TaxID=1081102 RepID=A0A167RIX2_9HYPO|nr:Target SNARE coiled-coil domain protein [Niveomyces insectorum RCEF 264]
MGGRVLGAPLPETERTREQDNTGVLQLQRQIFSEQDQEVAALGEIVQRQRALGLAIKDEVDEQTLLLEQLGDGVDRVQGKVKVAKERIKRLG